MSVSSIVRVATFAAALVLCGCPSKSEPSDGGTPRDGGSNKDGGSTHDAGTSPQVTLTVREALYPFEAPLEAGAWAAYQDGDGGWQEMTGADGGYAFTVNDAAGHYGVAVECPSGLPARILMVLTTVAESPTVSLSCPLGGIEFGTLKFTSSNWPSGTTGVLTLLGDESRTLLSTAGSTHSASAIPGLQDVAATATSSPGRWSKIILRHNELLADEGTESFDFNAGAASLSFQLDVTGQTADDTDGALSNVLLTALGARLRFATPVHQPSNTVDGPPDSLLLGTDRLMVGADFSNDNNGFRGDFQVIDKVKNVAVTPPPYLTVATLTSVNGAAQLIPTFHWHGGPSNPGLTLDLSQTNRLYDVAVSHGWLGDATQVTLPDLSSVPDFDPLMKLDPGQSVAVLAFVTGYTGPVEGVLNDELYLDVRALQAGQRLSYAGVSFNYTP